MRITTVPLQPRFLASLDKHHSKPIEIIRNKGGAVRKKTRDVLKVLDQVCTYSILQNLPYITSIITFLTEAIVIMCRIVITFDCGVRLHVERSTMYHLLDYCTITVSTTSHWCIFMSASSVKLHSSTAWFCIAYVCTYLVPWCKPKERVSIEVPHPLPWGRCTKTHQGVSGKKFCIY